MATAVPIDPATQTAPPSAGSLRTLVAAVVVSRLLVLLAALSAETVVGPNPNLIPGDPAPILQSLTSWDGAWYLGIVRQGYHAAAFPGGYHDYAFLPLYPMLVRLLSLPFPGWEGLIAVLLSNAMFVVAVVLLVRLTEGMFGRNLGYRSAAIMALFPFSAAFSMAYAESLFTALMLGAFLAVERRRPVYAGLLLALATLTRLQGVILLLPLVWVLWERSGRRRPSAGWLALLLGPLAAGAALGWVIWLTGDPSAYGAAQGEWGRLGLGGDPQGSLVAGFSTSVALVHAINFTVLIGATFLFVFVRRDRIPAAYVSVPALFLVVVFLSGSIQSIGRLLLPAFPYHWIPAKRRGALGRAWPAISAVLLFGISLLMFAGWFVP